MTRVLEESKKTKSKWIFQTTRKVKICGASAQSCRTTATTKGAAARDSSASPTQEGLALGEHHYQGLGDQDTNQAEPATPAPAP